jgi:hypothetical protein
MLRSGGPLEDGRQVGLDRAPDPGSGRLYEVSVLSVIYKQQGQQLPTGLLD